MESRIGRHNQRYSPTGDRLIVGTLPLTRDSPPRVLLINSRKHPNEWLLPKGGWENDETMKECAIRETWEEAGVVGELLMNEGVREGVSEGVREGVREGVSEGVKERREYDDQPLLYNVPVNGKNHTQLHTYYGLWISELKDEWPEREERGRRLFSCEEAKEILSAQERRRDREVQCSVLEVLLQVLSNKTSK
jgi:diphosphoinositol-polyphosphate diphosphatase